MNCPRCQRENPPQSRFCLECGVLLALACGYCAAEVVADAKFCNRCGQPIGGRLASAPRFASPGFYTPKYLAERILIAKALVEGERKHVTVLFADMRASLELLADRDPEEARTLTQPNIQTLFVPHGDVLVDPARAAQTIHAFLGGGLDPVAMAAAVDATLYRQRHQPGREPRVQAAERLRHRY
ncbi:MAG: double zinc ribbon domain-containing protein [Candidatus Rokuibacteriota bacterium]